jgi:outer membrane protein OmpA-like peptidoglycan-associated protein
MFVNEGMGLYTKSDVYNKRLSEIRAKSIKYKLKQQIIRGVR